MKISIVIFIIAIIITSCHKENPMPVTCNIQQAYAANALKVTITGGVWGTVSSMEGNCMPVVDPYNTTCKNCPVKRTVKIYEYTVASNAVPVANSSVFFESFSTALVAEVETDDNGFFQINIPGGHYTIVIVEDGKLYANGRDGQNGLSPFTLSGGILNLNLAMTYKAVF